MGEPDASVVFAGIRVKTDGTYEVDPDRLESIRNFPQPTTRRQLQRWLGLCQSLGHFAPTQLHVALDLQREICRNTQNSRCVWSPEAVKEFELAREILSRPSVLHKFEQKWDLGLAVDTAKSLGVGIILFQFDARKPPDEPNNFRLLGIWSIAAKPAWKDLSPLESEILGFYQAYQKLWFYVFGARRIYGYTDHQPFATSYNTKDLSELTPRMRKLMHE